MRLNDDTLVVMAPELSLAELDGEAVLMDPESGKYFGLNVTGLRILNAARTPVSVRGIVDRLANEHDAEPDQVRGDIITFLQAMVDKKLMSASPENSTHINGERRSGARSGQPAHDG